MSGGRQGDKSARVNHGSLSSIVSSLTRAQHGISNSSEAVDDDELDRHVAELLLADARKREREAVVQGARAYYDDRYRRFCITLSLCLSC